jgi:superfamily II DNA or RNA helicase
MPRRPNPNDFRFVNLHGVPIDPLGRRIAGDRSAPRGDEKPPQPLAREDIEAVFDALCIAGSPHGKARLALLMRGLAWRMRSGSAFGAGEVGAALRTLQAAGRAVAGQGQGYQAPPQALQTRLPALLAATTPTPLWRPWVWADQGGHGAVEAAPATVPYRAHADMVALVRLVLCSGVDAAGYNTLVRSVLGAASTANVIVEALTTPWMPALLERINPALLDGLLTSLCQSRSATSPDWQPLLAWLEARCAAGATDLPLPVRLLMAERRLHAGDMAGVDLMLAGLEGTAVPLLQAAQAAWRGQWPAAAEAFAAALKAAAKATGQRRGLAPAPLLELYALSLLAQHEAAAWTAARKLCVAESGSRKPDPYDGWGLWAHAAAVRLGDEPLDAEAFAHEPALYGREAAEANADRVTLAAWLGHRPAGWSDASVAATVRALHDSGQHWKADLVRQACDRLDLTPPPRHAGDAPAWPVAFYGARREAWRDALAAITALGAQRLEGSAAEPATLLQWRLRLDGEGRVVAITPFERPAGVRGPGKPRALTLARVKKAAQLDPRDAAVARCIEQRRYSASALRLDLVGAAIALINHPGLVFDDSPEQPVVLREALPLLEVLRQRDEAAGGSEQFVFRLADPLAAVEPYAFADRLDAIEAGAAQRDRLDNLRIVREGADSARLIRITPAQRRVAELVTQRWAVPVDAKSEIDAALRVLAGHFQLHSDAAAGEAVPSDARLHAQLVPHGDALQLRLLVQPFGGFGPTLLPGAGRRRLITLHEGLSLSTERDLDAEAAHLAAVLDELPFLGDSDTGDGSWRLEDPELALAAVERLPQLPAVASLDWPRGKPVRVITPPGSFRFSVGSGADWFAVDGELKVDEQRVLGLQRLMQLAAGSRRSRFVALGDGEYLALTERLRQQLADLQALGHVEKGTLRLPGAAAAWLAELLDGEAVAGDKAWRGRLQRLDEAAALQPEPPPALQAQLRGYQAEGLAWMVRLAHAGLGACLADDMGLGKTVQTLALLLQRADAGPALVIAPTSVCGNWAAEAARFAPSLRVQLYAEGDRETLLGAAGAGDLVIASYALVQIDGEAFAAREWATLVLDEAQALKNAATKRAKAIGSLRAGFRLALTGTPVENRLADLWSVMNLLNPGLLGSSAQFGERFANAIERQRDEAARGRLRRLVSPFLLRRTKAQVLTDLPPRTEIVHRIEPGPEERSFLEAARRSALERLATLAPDVGSGQAAFHVLAELTRLRRAACDPRLVSPESGLVGAKVREFELLATELVANRHKALVFSQFTDFLKLLGERLDAGGIAYQTLDGSTPAAERTRRVAAFQRGEGELFLISLKAGGFGLNLTAADYVLIVDPWWNPAAEDQAMGRAHRIGQHRPVTVYRLVTAGSVEERIIALHRDKRALADGILEGQDQGRPIGAEELSALLREP